MSMNNRKPRDIDVTLTAEEAQLSYCFKKMYKLAMVTVITNGLFSLMTGHVV